jgi:uncharacterized protein
MTIKDHGIISMDHKNLVNSYLKRGNPTTSEQTFMSLYAWRKGRPLKVVEADGSLLFLFKHEEYTTIFGPPHGEIKMQDAINAAKKVTGANVIAFERIPEQNEPLLKIDNTHIDEDRPNADYVYLKDDLLNLPGNRYHAKKNLVTQCVSSYDCKYEEISKQNIIEIRDFFERWCNDVDCGRSPGLCHEYVALTDIFENYWKFDLFGGALRIDGRVEAFTMGERLNHNTAVVHFEKATKKFRGSYQLINNWFVKNHLNTFEFINREQDMNIEGLRKAKMSYYPHHMAKKHTIYLDKSNIPPIKTLDELRCEEE